MNKAGAETLFILFPCFLVINVLCGSLSNYIIAESYAKYFEKENGCECTIEPQEEITMEI